MVIEPEPFPSQVCNEVDELPECDHIVWGTVNCGTVSLRIPLLDDITEQIVNVLVSIFWKEKLVPVSGDQTVEWMTHEQKLVEVLQDVILGVRLVGTQQPQFCSLP